MNKNSYYLLSLGCPKNEVDAECMSALLVEAGYVFAADPALARFLIVNTCAFLESAVEEAIEAILQLADQKGEESYLVVAGCLAQRYKEKICQEMPEVDAIIGTGEYGSIVSLLGELEAGQNLRHHRPERPRDLSYLNTARMPSAPRGTYAYLKIAEGCSNVCAFCAIPSIRGPFRSRQPDDIIREARRLTDAGVQELILVAQDTTRYGLDLPAKTSLADLLSRLTEEVPAIGLIRCLYFYAGAVTDRLIQEMADNPKVAHYVDLPIQHASNRILAAMRRHETIEMIGHVIERFRKQIPDVIIRSTVITGFPGENEEDFQLLLEAVRKFRFDRLGCFVYSAEEGTVAASLPGRVEPALAEWRRGKLMEIQQQISLESNLQRVGQVTPVLLEGVEERGILFQGRSYGEAPEIDPVLFVAATAPHLTIGSRPQVRIIDAKPYELIGVSLDEHRE